MSIAAMGTANAETRLRKTAPANSALAATGVKFGACGNKRATTSSPTRPIAIQNSVSGRSRTHSERRSLPIKAIICLPAW